MCNEAQRDTRQSLRRGWQRRCPRCGKGRVFEGYLQVRDSCDVCGLDFTPQRADDGPSYVTILVVGHLMAPGLHIAYSFDDPNPMVVAVVLCAIAAALCLLLLPRIKGALINYQWAKGLHGF